MKYNASRFWSMYSYTGTCHTYHTCHSEHAERAIYHSVFHDSCLTFCSSMWPNMSCLSGSPILPRKLGLPQQLYLMFHAMVPYSFQTQCIFPYDSPWVECFMLRSCKIKITLLPEQITPMKKHTWIYINLFEPCIYRRSLRRGLKKYQRNQIRPTLCICPACQKLVTL